MKKFIIGLLERYVPVEVLVDLLYIGCLHKFHCDYRFIDVGEEFKYNKEFCKSFVKYFGSDLLSEDKKYISIITARRIKLISEYFMSDKIYFNRTINLGSDAIAKFYRGVGNRSVVDHWSLNERYIN